MMGVQKERFQLGLVVGKFAPLHHGHELLIAHAAARCEQLLILSYTKPGFDRCGVAERRAWLAARCPGHEAIVLDDEWLAQECGARGLSPRRLPEDAAPDAVHQAFLAWLVHDVLARAPDAFFCSEDYGGSTARVLAATTGRPVRSVVVDRERQAVPIRGTTLRRNPHHLRDWVAPVVYASFVRRIALLGGESSGKTTLAEALAARHGTCWVAEYGRQRWDERGGELGESDLIDIAREQVRREELALASATRFLFCDTSPLTTLGYSLWMFGREAPLLVDLARRTYDGIVLCLPDIPFAQDGTRRSASFRETQHHWYRERLAALDLPVIEVGGSVERRVLAVTDWLEEAERD